MPRKTRKQKNGNNSFCVHRNEKISAPKNNNNMLQKEKEESNKDEISTYFSKSKMSSKKYIKIKIKKKIYLYFRKLLVKIMK